MCLVDSTSRFGLTSIWTATFAKALASASVRWMMIVAVGGGLFLSEDLQGPRQQEAFPLDLGAMHGPFVVDRRDLAADEDVPVRDGHQPFVSAAEHRPTLVEPARDEEERFLDRVVEYPAWLAVRLAVLQYFDVVTRDRPGSFAPRNNDTFHLEIDVAVLGAVTPRTVPITTRSAYLSNWS